MAGWFITPQFIGAGMTRRRTPKRTRESRRPRHRTRGQSEVLGVVLLLAITITGTGLVVAFGSSALDDSKRSAELDSAEHAMTQLDSKASLVGIGESDTQSISLGFDTVTRVENDSGRMILTIDPVDEPETEVLNQTLGAVVYENAGTTIAYQGGGVWRKTDGGSTMVSPPEVHYRETTLTLPLVVTAGQGPLDGKTVVRKNGTGEPMYPLEVEDGEDLRNPLTEAEVNLTVESEYYEAWGRFFESRTGGDAMFDHENQSVTLRLITPPKVPQVKQGVASTSSEQLEIKGGGGSDTFTDSYDSSKGTYAENDDEDKWGGTVKTVGGVTLTGDAEIRGDLVSGGGEVELSSANARVSGNVSYGGSFDRHKQATVGGWSASNGSVEKIDPVGSMVSARNESIRETGEERDRFDCDTTCELSAGQYYADGIHLGNGETLRLNLEDGNISLALSGPIVVDGGKIEVVNPSENDRVNVYMDASELTVVGAGNVSVTGDKAGKFRVYGPPGVEAEFSGSQTRFVGMLYAPNSESRQGEISVTTHAQVFGALVGGKTTLQSGGVVHFDRQLTQSSTLPPDYEVAPHVTYMHVSVNRVNVTSV